MAQGGWFHLVEARSQPGVCSQSCLSSLVPCCSEVLMASSGARSQSRQGPTGGRLVHLTLSGTRRETVKGPQMQFIDGVLGSRTESSGSASDSVYCHRWPRVPLVSGWWTSSTFGEVPLQHQVWERVQWCELEFRACLENPWNHYQNRFGKVYICVNKKSVRFGKFTFEFVDHTCQGFAAMHTASSEFWSGLLCIATSP